MAKINLREAYQPIIEDNTNIQEVPPLQPMTPISGLLYPRIPIVMRSEDLRTGDSNYSINADDVYINGISFNRLVEFLNTLGFNDGNYIRPYTITTSSSSDYIIVSGSVTGNGWYTYGSIIS